MTNTTEAHYSCKDCGREYQDDLLFCGFEDCPGTARLLREGTEHFQIVHNEGNHGTRWPAYGVQPKWEKTRQSKAALPSLAQSYRSAESLLDALVKAEAWYLQNRAQVGAA